MKKKSLSRVQQNSTLLFITYMMHYVALLLKNMLLEEGNWKAYITLSEDKSIWSSEILGAIHRVDFFLFVLLKTNAMYTLIGNLIYTRWKNYLLARSSAESSLEQRCVRKQTCTNHIFKWQVS